MGKISREDRIVIKSLRVEKNWSSCRFLNYLRTKTGPERALIDSSKKVDAGLPTDRIIGRGRHRSVRTASKIAQVEELICSQENAPWIRMADTLNTMFHQLSALTVVTDVC